MTSGDTGAAQLVASGWSEHSQEEDIQDIDAHLNGGIPLRDLDALERFWKAFPGMRKELFGPLREGYSAPLKGKRELRETISSHPEFLEFQQELQFLPTFSHLF